MNFRNKLVAVVGSTLLLASSITMGSAADESAEGSATVEIHTPGTLSVSITATNEFGGYAYSLEDRGVGGSMTVTVDDMRGTAAGWNVNLKATDFLRQEGSSENAAPIPIKQLTLTPETPSVNETVVQPAAKITGQTSNILNPVTTGDQWLWNAPNTNGAGKFDLKLAGTLIIPGGTLIGTYTSNVTVSLDTAP